MAATSAAAASLARITPSSSTFSKPSSFSAKPQRASFSACRAQKVSQSEEEQQAITRRLTLGLLAGVVAAGAKTAPASAAYGEAANIFGPPKKNTDYKTYQGDGFSIQIPSKWTPSKEKEYPGQVIRFEDIFDAVSNVSVMVIPTDKKSIKDYGPVENFLSEVNFLLGKQAFFGKTVSEGGFDANAVAQSSILDASTSTVNGKDYYNINLLTRTADGDEGGRHQLITATVAGGKLYMCKAQAGDKRWFKGAKRLVENTANSFQVA